MRSLSVISVTFEICTLTLKKTKNCTFDMNIFIKIWYVYSKTTSESRSRSIFSIESFVYIHCMENPMSEASLRHYCSGTYRGAIDQLDYIIELGFNALWTSPIPLNIDKETIYGVGWHGYWQGIKIRHKIQYEFKMLLFIFTEQNFTGNPYVINGATDPSNRKPLWKSNYDRSNWIFKYITQLNQIRSLIKDQLYHINKQSRLIMILMFITKVPF